MDQDHSWDWTLGLSTRARVAGLASLWSQVSWPRGPAEAQVSRACVRGPPSLDGVQGVSG